MLENSQQESDRVSRVAATPRERILQAAQQLFGAEDYEDVHVSRLYESAGVSRATFYRIFPSKEAVFREACSGPPPTRPNALPRARMGAREAFGQFGYDHVRMDDMIAASGVARSTFYRFFKDKAAVFLELDRTAFQYLRWELMMSSMDPAGRAPHLRFTVESFVEWRTQVGRSSLTPGAFPEPPEQRIVAFHTMLDGSASEGPEQSSSRMVDVREVVLQSRLDPVTIESLMVAADAIAQQPFEDTEGCTSSQQRVDHILALFEPVVAAAAART